MHVLMSCIAIYLIYQVPTQIPVCASVSTAIYLIHPAPVQIPVPVPVPVPVSAVLSTSTNTSTSNSASTSASTVQYLIYPVPAASVHPAISRTRMPRI